MSRILKSVSAVVAATGFCACATQVLDDEAAFCDPRLSDCEGMGGSAGAQIVDPGGSSGMTGTSGSTAVSGSSGTAQSGSSGASGSSGSSGAAGATGGAGTGGGGTSGGGGMSGGTSGGAGTSGAAGASGMGGAGGASAGQGGGGTSGSGGGGASGAGGSGSFTNIIIHANRDGSYATLGAGDYVYWGVAMSEGAAEVFESHPSGGGFKLRASSNNNWVREDTTDQDALIADEASEANAEVFMSEACGSWTAILVTSDADGTVYVKADGQNADPFRLEAQNATCDPASGTAWEKFELCEEGAGCMLTSGTP